MSIYAEPRGGVWAARNHAFLEHASDGWYRLVRTMRALATRYGRDPHQNAAMPALYSAPWRFGNHRMGAATLATPEKNFGTRYVSP